jgi:hypothetical protein
MLAFVWVLLAWSTFERVPIDIRTKRSWSGGEQGEEVSAIHSGGEQGEEVSAIHSGTPIISPAYAAP